MHQAAYQRFTQQLIENLQRDQRVVGLVAVGSMAGTDHQPDDWSDHDFLLVTEPGTEEAIRSSGAWLPNPTAIALHLRETHHGIKVLYKDGHLLEFAVFSHEEFTLAKINSHRVLIDRKGFAAMVQQVLQETEEWKSAQAATDEWLFGRFLTHVLVGAGRHARGEQLSGAKFVKELALGELVQLLSRHRPPKPEGRLDSLDPLRRFEQAYPELGAELNAAIRLETPQAARHLLRIAEAELAELVAQYQPAVGAVWSKLDG